MEKIKEKILVDTQYLLNIIKNFVPYLCFLHKDLDPTMYHTGTYGGDFRLYKRLRVMEIKYKGYEFMTEKLSSEIKHLENQLAKKKVELKKEKMYSTCNHLWGDVMNDDIITESYTIEGDPPGTMGADRRSSCYVPAKTEKRWKRTCEHCGKTEYTTKIIKTTAPEF